ncbi:CLUMA_CG012148, isoform A [Clunio marinus]|uniref:CLUMA_CG012148, isoform A n=1 Tax=Clunio marinus TaxID=568069 RepID=A0A1J1IGY4_9DIPT|nr:CLUMA_CG012148, isoform A [Clunio marinus]
MEFLGRGLTIRSINTTELEKMVYCSSTNMSSQNESEVESLLMSPCWNSGTNGQDYLLDGHKLLLDHDLESLPSDSETQKSSLDMLDNLLSNSNNISSNTNLAELKPLPPFTGYTGHLSINGISGHHYHAIAQRMPEENNNNYTQSSYQNQCGTNNNTTDHNIVSSSTCLPDSVLNPDGADSCLSDVKLFSDNSIDGKIYSITSADSCVITSGPDSVSNGNQHNNINGARIFVDAKELAEYDMSSIEDIAAIIGSAIADTTVPNNRSDNGENGGDTRDSWMDLDAWIEDTVVPQDSKLIVSHNDALNDFILPHSPMQSTGSTLQSLLTHGYMPLLQNRLQNGPPIKIEAPTSTSYCNEIISTVSSNGGNSHQQQMQQQVQNQTNVSVSAHGFQSPNDLSGLLGKEKPVHRCTICNRGFLNKSNIKVHLRTHTGEKPFRCEICAKAFRQKAHLIKHQQIHKRIGRD